MKCWLIWPEIILLELVISTLFIKPNVVAHSTNHNLTDVVPVSDYQDVDMEYKVWCS